MCIVCVEYNQGKLTIAEAIRNVGEVAGTQEHYEEVVEKLQKDAIDHAFKKLGEMTPEEFQKWVNKGSEQYEP